MWYKIWELISYFCVNTMKYIKCMQEKIEFPCMLQRPRLISTKILGDLSLAIKTKEQ